MYTLYVVGRYVEREAEGGQEQIGYNTWGNGLIATPIKYSRQPKILFIQPELFPTFDRRGISKRRYNTGITVYNFIPTHLDFKNITKNSYKY